MSFSQPQIIGFLKRRRRSSSLSDCSEKENQVKKRNRISKSLSPKADRAVRLDNMASKESDSTGGEEDIREMLRDIKETQNRLLQSVEAKFKNMQTNMEKEFKELRTHVDLEVATVSAKIELPEKRVIELEERTLEPRVNEFEPEVSIVCINLTEEANENLQEKVTDLVQDGLGLRGINPLRVLRLKARNNKPGLVKIECSTKEDKIRILRQKGDLKDTTRYNRVYLRTSLSHTDRVMQHNFQKILSEMPNGHRYRVSGHGKIIDREEVYEDSEVDRGSNPDHTDVRNRERLDREHR